MKLSVQSIRKKILADARCKTDKPLYIYDAVEVQKSVKEFFGAFKSAGLPVSPFFAMKSNPYPGLLKTLIALDVGIDVSSEAELEIALKAKAKKIIVTGPGKTPAFFKRLVQTKEIKVIYLESLEELARLKKACRGTPHFKVGVRVVPSAYASWVKFGIPLKDLSLFIQNANDAGFGVEAVQFHISYVKDAKTHAKALEELAAYASKKLSNLVRYNISIIDIGGGFTPETFEGDFPWNPKGYSLFEVDKITDKILSLPKAKRATFSKPASLAAMAESISSVWKKKVQLAFPKAKLLAEPGRYLSHACMHILLSVIDKKTSKSVILNGGWNMLGWEKYQYISYVPTYNVDSFSASKEFPCLMYGNLCLPDDIWGYYLYGSSVNIGDRILLPYQGAYTYTYRQEFIRGIPKVIDW